MCACRPASTQLEQPFGWVQPRPVTEAQTASPADDAVMPDMPAGKPLSLPACDQEPKHPLCHKAEGLLSRGLLLSACFTHLPRGSNLVSSPWQLVIHPEPRLSSA